MMNPGKERGLWKLHESDSEKADAEVWGCVPAETVSRWGVSQKFRARGADCAKPHDPQALG
jgi:hypothetical protein